MNKTSTIKLLAILILSSILMRIPAIYAQRNSKNISWDEANYYFLSKNLAEGRGYLIPLKEIYGRFLDTEEPYKHQILHKGVWMPPGYPFLGALSMKIHETSLFSLVILNMFLFLLSVLLFFDFVRLQFNKNIAFIAALFFSLHPMLFQYSTNTMSESSYLFLIMLSFWTALKYCRAHYSWKWLLLFSLASSATLLTRNSGVFNVVGFFVWLLYLKKYMQGAVYLLITVAFWSVWEIGVCWILFGANVSRFFSVYLQSIHPLGDVFPAASLLNRLLKMGFGTVGFLRALTGLNLFYFFAPFVFLGVFRIKDLVLRRLLEFSVIFYFIFIAMFGIFRDRYFIWYIPAGILAVLYFVEDYINDRNMKNGIFALLVFTSLLYVYMDIKIIKDTMHIEKKMHQQDVLIKKIVNEYTFTRYASSDPMAICQADDSLESILVPFNITEKITLEKILRQYRIQAILLFYEDKIFYHGYPLFQRLYQSNGRQIRLKDSTLELESKSDGKYVLYRFSDNQ